ncbi:hypothetical protein KY289_015379 [Solanum tuberosum]|nr:hypothetical protein KY289_015379 [Solanum tuberosum]
MNVLGNFAGILHHSGSMPSVQGQISLCHGTLSFGLAQYAMSEFELLAEELSMSDYVIKPKLHGWHSGVWPSGRGWLTGRPALGGRGEPRDKACLGEEGGGGPHGEAYRREEGSASGPFSRRGECLRGGIGLRERLPGGRAGQKGGLQGGEEGLGGLGGSLARGLIGGERQAEAY